MSSAWRKWVDSACMIRGGWPSEPLRWRMICDRVPFFGAFKKLIDNIGYPWLNTEFICLSLRLPGLIIKNNLFQKPNQK